MFEKEGHKAQQGTIFNQTVPQQNFTIPNINQLPNQGYDFSYNGFNPQPAQNTTQFGQSQFSNYSVPDNIDYSFNPQKSFSEYNQVQAPQEPQTPTNPYTTNSVNIVNPYGNIGLEASLNYAGGGFGSGNYGQAAVGTGLSLLKGARNFLTGYSTGKENKRVGQEYTDKTFDRTPNYAYGQQGGNYKNSDIIAQNAITDQGQGNVNLEGGGKNKVGEYVLRTTGQLQPVIGDRHINGEGVDTRLNDGDMVINDSDMKSSRLTAKNAKELKDRFNLSNMKGKTHAQAVTAVGSLLGTNKLEKEKASVLEQIEKANKIKDVDSKQLSLSVLTQKIAGINEKLNTLAEPRREIAQFIFELQEQKPKKGDGTQIYDKNGKEVTESKEEVAQQGLQYTTKDQSYGAQRVSNVLNSGTSDDNMGINLRKIKSIQSGVTNDKLGNGYYIYYDKLPTDTGFDPNRNREFVTQEAYSNTVLRAPAYQEYMKSMTTPINNTQLAELQQGGKFTEQEKKIIQELVQKENIFGSFGDGHISKEGFEYGKAADYRAKPLYGVNYNRNEQILEEARRVVLENRAKRNNEIKSLKSSDSYIDNVKGYAKDLLGFQQGGKIETLAKKHGLSLERAQELMSYQQGGEQEASQENQMQQVFQAVAEMLQRGMQPEQVAEQLVQMGVPEEQVGQLIQEVAQQMQGQSPQEEQMEGQYSNEQEEGMEVAQQGGEKEYYQSGGGYSFSTRVTPELKGYDTQGTSVLNQDTLSDVEEWQPYTGKGYGAKMANIEDTIKVHNWYFDTEEKKKAFKEAAVKEGKQPEVEAFQKAYNIELENRAKKAGLPETDISGIKQQVGFSDKGVQKVDGLFGAFTSTRPLYNFTKKDGVVEVKAEVTPNVQTQQAVESKNNVKNIMPNFGSYIPLFSPMSPIAKETVEFSRAEPVKVTPESMLAEQENKRQSDIARVEQSGLSPQQQAAVLGQGLASSQMASNDAISKAEQFNANNLWQTDNLNLGTQAKEDIMNAQFRQDYQGKALQTLANQEESMRNQYRSNFLQGEKDRQYIDQVNKANMMSDQFALVPGQGIVALNNKPAELPKMYIPKAVYDKMTAEEVNAIKKKAGATGMQLQIS